MKLTRTYGVVGLVVAFWLPASALPAGNEPEWWHGHGHGGGGIAAVGKLGDPSKVSRTVVLTVSDGSPFAPSTITVKRGETVRFVVKNSGRVTHEMVLGTDSQLTELYHTRMQGGGKKLTTSNAITINAGNSAELIWEFTKFGTISFGCLLPGHYDTGEKGTIIVR
ncbi:cupredoxin domain-containing protein [Cupriavidus pinatubonensis]|uniref:Blue (type 1) copper domain-containing protein n=1 Tax=Cupriavidus pinatubonensis TaxID=248026 RepID=A0ABM8XU72_9BURK|nr:plastocyanin/azurin family copper-binding protein [Cupriavidus pinatubonensis]CAG9183921.1 hypothetical protein LMG23994_05264 [Cupriavidus pinatubonensis]